MGQVGISSLWSGQELIHLKWWSVKTKHLDLKRGFSLGKKMYADGKIDAFGLVALKEIILR